MKPWAKANLWGASDMRVSPSGVTYSFPPLTERVTSTTTVTNAVASKQSPKKRKTGRNMIYSQAFSSLVEAAIPDRRGTSLKPAEATLANSTSGRARLCSRCVFLPRNSSPVNVPLALRLNLQSPI
jgi:hypothetical protein